MPTSRAALGDDALAAPSKPAEAPQPRIGDPPAWDATTSTPIFGAHADVPLGTLMTFGEAGSPEGPGPVRRVVAAFSTGSAASNS